MALEELKNVRRNKSLINIGTLEKTDQLYTPGPGNIQ